MDELPYPPTPCSGPQENILLYPTDMNQLYCNWLVKIYLFTFQSFQLIIYQQN